MQRQEEKKFYLIEISYQGPDVAAKGHRADMVEVSPVPGRKNMSGEECETGWLGTTDDWHRQAVGSYDEASTRLKLAEYGIKLPATAEVKYVKFCHAYKNAEWYNRRFCY